MALHVTSVVPSGNVEPEAGIQSGTIGPSKLSLAEATKLTTAPEGPVASIVISDGTVTTGGIVSVMIVNVTVTVKLPFAVFLFASVAEQLTVVCPMGKMEPEAGVQVTGTEPATRSVAEAEKFTTVPAASVVSTVISAGKFKAGAVVSTTVTWKLAVPVLPCESVAEQLTVVVPKANVDPEAGAQVGVREPSILSFAETVKLTTAPDGPVASAVISAGTVTTGKVLSTRVTVTVKLSLAVFPLLSVAEQLTVVVPIGKVEPEAGEHVTATLPSTRSVAEAVNVTTVPN